MNRPSAAALKPRKSPRQARSTVTVAAIRTATIQVLLAEGASRLTTTRVADRAGVSVGTLYQYFPHKQALLVSLLETHVGELVAAMEHAAAELAGRDLAAIATGLAQAWLAAKAADIDTAQALYAVAAEFDLAELLLESEQRLVRAIGHTLASASDARFADLEAATFMLVTLLGGSMRTAMESHAGVEALPLLRRELPRACHAYLAQAALTLA